MSKTETQSKDYKIELTDIRGVGPKTVEKLNEVRISTVQELHLMRERHNPAYRNLREKGVGKDTLEHLSAVGSAVHYTGGDRVQAKHLTCSLADDAEFGSSFVDISAESDESDTSEESPKLPKRTTQELQNALEAIWSEYGEGYDEQVSFEADVGRFKSENERFDDISLGTGIVQSVMRYRHDAETVESQRDFTDEKKALLVAFGESL